MNNNQGEMDAQDALPPLIKRVDQQLTPCSQAPRHPRLDLNPSSPGRLCCTQPSEITDGVAWVIFRSVWLVRIIM